MRAWGPYRGQAATPLDHRLSHRALPRQSGSRADRVGIGDQAIRARGVTQEERDRPHKAPPTNLPRACDRTESSYLGARETRSPTPRRVHAKAWRLGSSRSRSSATKDAAGTVRLRVEPAHREAEALRTVSALWDAIAGKTREYPRRLSVAASELVEWPARQSEMFERNGAGVQEVLDRVRARFGAPAVTLGDSSDPASYTGLDISFEHALMPGDFKWLGIEVPEVGPPQTVRSIRPGGSDESRPNRRRDASSGRAGRPSSSRVTTRVCCRGAPGGSRVRAPRVFPHRGSADPAAIYVHESALDALTPLLRLARGATSVASRKPTSSSCTLTSRRSPTCRTRSSNPTRIRRWHKRWKNGSTETAIEAEGNGILAHRLHGVSRRGRA